MRGVFFGSSPVIAEIINKTIGIDAIALQSQSFTKEIFDFSHYIDAELILVDKNEDILEISNQGDIGISYGFGLKFSRQAIDYFPQGILNIHTGDLPNYRSRHPMSWAMIKGESRIGITIHKVDEQIDCGNLVHKFYVERLFLDDLDTLENKIKTALVDEFPRSIEKLANNDFEKLEKGSYLNRIDKVFATVDPGEMQSKQLFSLFRSQKIYGGVSILGQKKIECHIYKKDFDSYYDGYEIYKCSDDVLVAIK
jgi:methionyl-tRNA formyltransferase